MVSRTSRILLVVALLAAGAYLLIERPRERAHDRNVATNDRLASFDAAAIDSIAIERPTDRVQFIRADSTWRLVAPVSDSAEPGTIGTLLDALRTADINRHLGPTQDLAPYGLDHPGAVVTLAAAHHIILEVAVGKNTVDNAWCYARTASGDVLLVPTDVHQSSTLPVDAYRNRRVAAFQVNDVTAYAVTSPNHLMSWYRRGPTWYTLAGRDTIAGDSVAVPSPLHRLRGLRAASFPAPGDTIATPADSERVMTLSMGPRHVTLRFARRGSAWLVRNVSDARTMTVNDDINDLFAHTTTELRDRRLLQFDPAMAEHIAFTTPKAGGEIVRAGGHWSFPNPAMGRVNAEHAADFVRALRALKWAEPGGEAARTGAHQLYHIEISGAGGRLIDELTAGPYDATTVWVSSLSSHGSWLIARSTLDDVGSRFARVKER
jgi:Domain of unknown function (DUF4340)